MVKSTSTVSPVNQMIRRCAFVAALTLCAPTVATAEYRLQPGDVVRFSVAGLPESVLETAVDIDGNLSLAWFGTVNAAGRPLSEVRRQVQARSVGQVIKRYNNEGELKLVNVNAEDIFLQILSYQPIIVGGDVEQPGEYTFRPGLTVRAALALAGGQTDLLVGDDLQDQIQLLRWQNDFAEAALNHASANLTYWRLSAEIAQDYDMPPPNPNGFRVSASVYEELLAEQRRLMEIARSNDDGQRAYLERALVQAKARQSILTQQKARQSEAIAADEEEEARVKELLAGGLTNASRVSDARRAVVLTATRLLEVEESLARVELDITRMSREKSQFEEDRMTRLLEARDVARNMIYTAKLSMDSLSRLQSTSQSATLDSITGVPTEPTVVIHRRVDDKIKVLEATLDDEILPGDTLSFSLNSFEEAISVPQTQ